MYSPRVWNPLESWYLFFPALQWFRITWRVISTLNPPRDLKPLEDCLLFKPKKAYTGYGIGLIYFFSKTNSFPFPQRRR
jgi:hypothetical protein